jgi:hypothetical protein
MAIVRNRNLAEHLPYSLDREFAAPQPIPPGEYLNVHLTVDGTVGGSEAMNVNGSVTPVVFKYIVPSGYTVFLRGFTFQLVDANIDWIEFGGIAELSVGVLVEIYDSNDVQIAALPTLKNNYETAMVFGAGNVSLIQGAATDNLIFHMDLVEQIGHTLSLPEGWYVKLTVRDDLTGLTHCDALLTGRKVAD